jgi:hypothetical protein
MNIFSLLGPLGEYAYEPLNVLFSGAALDQMPKNSVNESLIDLASDLVFNTGTLIRDDSISRKTKIFLDSELASLVLGSAFMTASSVLFRVDPVGGEFAAVIDGARAVRNTMFRTNQFTSEASPMRVLAVGLVQEEHGSTRRNNAVTASVVAKSMGTSLKKSNETVFNRTACYELEGGKYDGWVLCFDAKTEGSNAGAKFTIMRHDQAPAKVPCCADGEFDPFHLDGGPAPEAGTTVFVKPIGGAVPNALRTADGDEVRDPVSGLPQGAASSCYARNKLYPDVEPALTQLVEPFLYQVQGELMYGR